LYPEVTAVEGGMARLVLYRQIKLLATTDRAISQVALAVFRLSRQYDRIFRRELVAVVWSLRHLCLHSVCIGTQKQIRMIQWDG